MNKAILRGLQAAIFALGAPLGWLLIKFWSGADIVIELSDNWGLYAYMLFGTLLVFISFGSYVGRKEQFITELAIRDSLTGIYNLRYFIERVEQEISRAKRHTMPLSLIYFDLDFFKKINDRYGHPVGDKVLKQVADTIKEMIRAHDIFARVGGEEFAILLPRCSLDDAVQNAERIRKAVQSQQINIQNGSPVQVTISAGVTAWSNNEQVTQFYKRADEKLYLAKQHGRNQVVS